MTLMRAPLQQRVHAIAALARSAVSVASKMLVVTSLVAIASLGACAGVDGSSTGKPPPSKVEVVKILRYERVIDKPGLLRLVMSNCGGAPYMVDVRRDGDTVVLTARGRVFQSDDGSDCADSAEARIPTSEVLRVVDGSTNKAVPAA